MILDLFKIKLGVDKVIFVYWYIIFMFNLEVDKFSLVLRGGIFIEYVKFLKFLLGNNFGL